MSDLKCWMCNGLGAVQQAWSSEYADNVWLPFKPHEHINLAHNEHVCPACRGGSDNPPSEFERQIREREQRQRQVEVDVVTDPADEFPLRLEYLRLLAERRHRRLEAHNRPAGRVARPPTVEGSAPADTPGASDSPASRT